MLFLINDAVIMYTSRTKKIPNMIGLVVEQKMKQNVKIHFILSSSESPLSSPPSRRTIPQVPSWGLCCSWWMVLRLCMSFLLAFCRMYVQRFPREKVIGGDGTKTNYKNICHLHNCQCIPLASTWGLLYAVLDEWCWDYVCLPWLHSVEYMSKGKSCPWPKRWVVVEHKWNKM